MGETQMGSSLWNSLKCLCSAHGWSYAIFWRSHPPNSLFLSVEDAYYEGLLGQEIIKTLPQLQFLGEGIVGHVAFTGKPSWIFSDAQSQEWNLTGVFWGLDHCELDSELRQQFSHGIKTIAVISVKPLGVVQFGSTEKILEREEIFEQTQRLLMENDYLDTVDEPEKMVLPWDFENYDLNGLLTSENLCSWNLNHEDHNNINEQIRDCYFSSSMDNSLLSTYKNQENGMTSLHGESSCLSDQLTTGAEAQMVLSEKDSFEVLLNPKSCVKNPCFGPQSSEASLASSMAWDISVQDSALTSLYSVNRSMLGSGGSFQDKLWNPLEYNAFAQSLHGLSKMSTEDLSDLCSVDDICQRFASSPEHSTCATNTALENSLSKSLEFNNPTCVAFNGDPAKSISDGHPTSTLMHTFESSSALDFVGECWGNMIAPVMKSATITASSECRSGLNIVTPNATKKGLFAELGIEELLNGGSSFEDQISTTKRRRTDSSGNTNPVSNLDKTNNLVCKKETFPKSLVGSWLDHGPCFNGAKVVPQKPEESTKASKKRARPGESTRPRPKDRQQIQDRIKELRGIIPSGGKCSIDSLLDRTIKYMLFLQSVTKYAGKLQEPKSPKLIEEGNSMVVKNKSVEESDTKDGGGVTWAFEVAGQTMACPIIVEDMSQPGQMLIEMLCEEQGLFLEIAEIIRGFGLNILKGKMEIRENKLWGRFIVEASRNVTRIDVFWYLVQLLPQSGTDSYQKTEMALPAMAMT
ncbi:transcription factor LHW [Prosopis cineraria]|uniref:transcription factor LHW n=1 Tax=Prosopis cineraria TaxID=364024 RepID=UPI0024103A60|nr:transcription factor LHW [Prosopis cineraria]